MYILKEKEEAPIFSDERFLFDLEIVRIAAYALLEPRVHATSVLAASQNELFVAAVASYRYFISIRQRVTPP